jgi:hypothetical protein
VRLDSELDGGALDRQVTIEALSLEAAYAPRDRGHSFLRCQ